MQQGGGQGWLGGAAGYAAPAPAAPGYGSAGAGQQPYPASNGTYAYDQQQHAAYAAYPNAARAAAVGGYNYSNGGALATDAAAAGYYQQHSSGGYPPAQQQYGAAPGSYDPQQAYSGAAAAAGGSWAPGAAAPYPPPTQAGYPQAGSSSGHYTTPYPPGNPAADAAGGGASYTPYPGQPYAAAPAAAAPYPAQQAYPGPAPYTPPPHPQQQLQHQGSSIPSSPAGQGLLHQGSSSIFPVPTGPCYDVTVVIEKCTKLPVMDWHTFKADPYIVCKFVLPSGHSMAYRTQTIKRDLNPVYNETVVLYSIPQGTRFDFQVTDKDLINLDRLIAHGEYKIDPAQAQGKQSVAVPLTMSKKDRGQLHLQVKWSPCMMPVSPFMGGPVRYRAHMSPLAGALLGAWQDDNSLQFCTYKLYLLNIEEMFLGVSCPWNRSYDKARQIFESTTLSSTITTQHKALYATSGVSANRSGTVSSPDELFKLLNYGRRGGQLRYFTYTLLKDSMRFSETGAAFLADMFSKHAMHANCTPEVLMAGEFLLCPDPAAPGGHRVVVDNNSGTYAPPAALLPRLVTLLQRNFPGLAVEMVATDDPRLKQYHAMVPSRKAPA